jgi:hypothetical protein
VENGINQAWIAAQAYTAARGTWDSWGHLFLAKEIPPVRAITEGWTAIQAYPKNTQAWTAPRGAGWDSRSHPNKEILPARAGIEGSTTIQAHPKKSKTIEAQVTPETGTLRLSQQK